MVQSLLSLTEVRDAETGKHSRRTQAYTRVLAQQLSAHPDFRDYLTPDRVELLASLAPLHDIGKVGVPDQILHKPGQLTAEEFAEMRKHPGYGRDVIVHAEDSANVHDDVILTLAKDIVYTHHEKWDGSGYPQGLHGRDIPIPGRVMAIVDVYDASTTRQLYRTPLSHDDAIAFILKRPRKPLRSGRRRRVSWRLSRVSPPVARSRDFAARVALAWGRRNGRMCYGALAGATPERPSRLGPPFRDVAPAVRPFESLRGALSPVEGRGRLITTLQASY